MKKTIVGITAGIALLSAVSIAQASAFTVPSGMDVDEEFWMSTEYASGYVYKKGSLPDLASMLLSAPYVNNPTGISISQWDDDMNIWTAWVALTFNAEGAYLFSDDVDAFKLSGIDPEIGKDAGQALFLTGVTFVAKTIDAGIITQKPINSVPEPATVLLLASGLLGFGWRKKQ